MTHVRLAGRVGRKAGRRVVRLQALSQWDGRVPVNGQAATGQPIGSPIDRAHLRIVASQIAASRTVVSRIVDRGTMWATPTIRKPGSHREIDPSVIALIVALNSPGGRCRVSR